MVNSPVDAHSSRVDPETVAAIEQAHAAWRAELADLGGRNSLMWHRELPTGTIDLTVAHPGGVAKLLAGHTTLLSELMRESVALAEARRRVAAIRGKALELQREHGMSTLFLAVGMASWHLPRAPLPPRAPVLLRGARIHPTDATRRDYVLRLDADVVFNPALEHYLRGERGVELDGHELAQMSAGRHGFDPRPTYEVLEHLCGGIEQFGIGPQLVLSTYPLAKLALVAELTGPVENLTRSSHLVELVRAQASGEELAEQGSADTSSPAVHRPTVLPADASQREVLSLLAGGQSAVLDAVPGTGRTQTIANVVGQAITDGGSVLVAAEHRRALEDVMERLRGIGLGDLVLDLRETAAAARRAAATLLDDLDRPRTGGTDSASQGQDQAADRDGDQADFLRQTDDSGEGAARPESQTALGLLAAHERHLHGDRPPWGVSLAQTQDVLTRLVTLPHPPASHVRLEPAVLAELTPASLGEIRDALTRAVGAGAWKRRADDPWFGAQISTAQEAEHAAGIVASLVSGRFTAAREEVDRLCRDAGLPAPVNLRQWSRTFDLLRRVRDTLDVFAPQVYEAPLEELVSATAKASRSGADRVPATSRLRLRRQAKRLLRPGTPPPDLSDRLAHALEERTQWQALAGRAARPSTPRGWEDAATEYAGIATDLSWLATALAPTAYGKELDTTHLDLLLERLVRLDAQADRLPIVAAVHSDLQPLRDRGLGALVDDLARRGVAAEHVESEADLVFWASIHDQITAQGTRASSVDLCRAVTDLESEQHSATERARDLVLAAAAARVDTVRAAHPEQEEALRAVVDAGAPLRVVDLLAAAPDLVSALRPVWLVSPLTVPATIPSEVRVDLLVIDEAHRVPLAHAVPALSRAERVLVVGDSGGLPGEPFASVVDERAHSREDISGSTLSAALGAFPVRGLETHYRSLDQRMIPQRAGSAVAGFPGVLRSPRLRTVEAEDLEGLIATTVDLILDHARRSPGQSLGVLVDDADVTMDLERALLARIASAPDLRGSFREDVSEPFLLGTVERAVGDVRDRVVLVLTGRPGLSEAWAASALGSARRNIVVVSDGPVQDLPDSPGVALTRHTITAAAAQPDGAAETRVPTAETGEEVGTVEKDTTVDAVGAAEAHRRSALVEDLAERLRAEDLTVRSGFGTGPHRIELVVDDPAEPGRPLLAIDTDALPSGEGLDADLLSARSAQLRRLGWTPVRVWTTDVFRDPAREVARLVEIARRASLERHS